jgi:hypothetical protein
MIATCNIATYPSRIKLLEETLRRMCEHFDIVRIYFNEYKEPPQFIKQYKNIEYIIGKENLRDTGKFYFSNEYRNEYYFTCDDDILYSKAYINKMIAGIKRHNAVVTMHGRKLVHNPKNYYSGKVYSYFGKLENDKQCNYVGTGLTAFDLRTMKVDLSIFKTHGKTDEYFSKALQDFNIKTICISHDSREVIFLPSQEALWSENSLQLAEFANIMKTPIKQNIKKRTYLPRIVISIPFYSRSEITSFVFQHYYRLKLELQNSLDLILIAVGENEERHIAEDNGFEFVECENILSKKINKGFKYSQVYEPDAVLKIDSDTIITKEYFINCIDWIKQGLDYVGIIDIYFAFQNTIKFWQGYTNHRRGEGHGVGRFISSKLLKQVNFEPVNKEAKRGIDSIMHTNLMSQAPKYKTFYMSDLNCEIIELKSDFQITDVNHFVWTANEHPKFNTEPVKHLLTKYTELNNYSVIIPTYNAAKYIEQCIDSIWQSARKSNTNIEIIVGVDGCKETFKKIEKYTNINIKNFEINEGTYATLNKLIPLCKYENICIIGSDDYVYENYFAAINTKIHNADVVRYKFTFMPTTEISKFHAYGSLVIKRSIFEKYGLYENNRVASDYLYINKLHKSTKFAYIEEPIYYYRQHSEQITKSKEYGINSERRNNIIKDFQIKNTK